MKNKKKKIFGILLLILIFGTTVIFGVTNKQYAGDQGTIDITESTIANNLVLDYIGQFIFAIGNIFQTVTGWIMQILTGNNIFPWADKVVFNTIPLLDVNFINPEVNSLFSIAEDSIGIGQVIRNIYFTGLSISLGFMGIIIAVMAIKLAISSIGSEKAKYKEAITTWATSLVLLFAMHYFIAFMFYMNEQLVIVASSILSNTIEEAGDELADAINANLAETRKDTIENFIDKAHEDQIGAKDLATLRDNEAITYLLLNNPTIKGTYLNLIYGNDQGSNMKTGFDFKKSVKKIGTNSAILIDNISSWASGDITVAAQQAQLLAKGVEAIRTAQRAREVETSEEFFNTLMESYNDMSHEELVWQVANNYIGEYDSTDEERSRVNALETDDYPYPQNWLDYIASKGIAVPDFDSMTDQELHNRLEEYERKSMATVQNNSIKVYEDTVKDLESSLGPDNFCTIVYKYALQAVKGELNLEVGGGEIISSLGEYFKQTAWTIDEENGGWSPTKVSIVSAILYTIFVFQSISFFIAYLKRLFIVVVLAVLAPFVVIYEFFRKSAFGGSKGGIISSWLRELGTLIFVQTFQAFLLAVVMSIIVKAISGTYAKGMEGGLEAVGLLAIFALLSLPKLELLVKNIFGLTSGVADTSLARGQRSFSAGSVLALRAARRLTDNPKKVVGGFRKMLGAAANHYDQKKSLPNKGEGSEENNSLNEISSGNSSSLHSGNNSNRLNRENLTLSADGTNLSSAIQSLTQAVDRQSNIMNAQEMQGKNGGFKEGAKDVVGGLAETVGAMYGAVAGATINAGFNKSIAEGALVGAGAGDKVGEVVVEKAIAAPGVVKDAGKVTAGVLKDVASIPSSISSAIKSKSGKGNESKKVVNNVKNTTNIKNTFNNKIENSGSQVNTKNLGKEMSSEITESIQKELDSLKKDVNEFKKAKGSSSNEQGISGKDIEKQLSDAIKKNSNSTNKDKGKKVINVDDLD